jgi:RNA polymerase sigma-70 factor (ECF subfamily)
LSRFETLLVEEIPALRRYARALLCGDLSEADDLVQECLARAVSRRKLWIGHRGIRPWLFTILHNIFVNDLRRQVNSRFFETPDDYAQSIASEQDADLLCAVSDFEKALQQLSADQREVLLLVGLEQMSYKEISKITGAPVGTVMSRLSRAREQLCKCLDGEIKIASIKRVK